VRDENVMILDSFHVTSRRHFGHVDSTPCQRSSVDIHTVIEHMVTMTSFAKGTIPLEPAGREVRTCPRLVADAHKSETSREPVRDLLSSLVE